MPSAEGSIIFGRKDVKYQGGKQKSDPDTIENASNILWIVQNPLFSHPHSYQTVYLQA